MLRYLTHDCDIILSRIASVTCIFPSLSYTVGIHTHVYHHIFTGFIIFSDLCHFDIVDSLQKEMGANYNGVARLV